MQVLVIGGTGFLSSAVVAELQGAGHAVTVLTRGQRPLLEGVQALVGDRGDEEGFLRLLEGRPFDAVVDCICYTAEEARADLRAFGGGRTGRLVFISTDFVYGPDRTLPIDEDTGTQALSEYGRKKAACEEVFFAAHAEDGFPVTVLRPPHIMGAGGQLGTGSLQGRDPMLLDRMRRGAPVVLLDGGALLIQPVVHRDVGRACAALLGRSETLGQAYNMAGPESLSTREYYDLVAAVLGVEAVVLSLPSELFAQAYPERAPFAFHRVYSMGKLARDAGFRPETSVRHAIFEMIDWLQANDAAKPYVETEQDREIAALCHAFGEEALRVLK